MQQKSAVDFLDQKRISFVQMCHLEFFLFIFTCRLCCFLVYSVLHQSSDSDFLFLVFGFYFTFVKKKIIPENFLHLLLRTNNNYHLKQSCGWEHFNLLNKHNGASQNRPRVILIQAFKISTTLLDPFVLMQASPTPGFYSWSQFLFNCH